MKSTIYTATDKLSQLSLPLPSPTRASASLRSSPHASPRASPRRSNSSALLSSYESSGIQSRRQKAKINGVWIQFRILSKYLFKNKCTPFYQNLNSDQRSHLNAYYMQATIGPNTEARKFACFIPDIQLLQYFNFLPTILDGFLSPPSSNVIDWQVWKNLGNMKRIDAAARFISLISLLDPDYLDEMVEINIPENPRQNSSSNIFSNNSSSSGVVKFTNNFGKVKSLPPVAYNLRNDIKTQYQIKELIIYEAASCIQALIRGVKFKKHVMELRLNSLSNDVLTLSNLLESTGLNVFILETHLLPNKSIVYDDDDNKEIQSPHYLRICNEDGLNKSYLYLKPNEQSNDFNNTKSEFKHIIEQEVDEINRIYLADIALIKPMLSTGNAEQFIELYSSTNSWKLLVCDWLLLLILMLFFFNCTILL